MQGIFFFATWGFSSPSWLLEVKKNQAALEFVNIPNCISLDNLFSMNNTSTLPNNVIKKVYSEVMVTDVASIEDKMAIFVSLLRKL